MRDFGDLPGIHIGTREGMDVQRSRAALTEDRHNIFLRKLATSYRVLSLSICRSCSQGSDGSNRDQKCAMS